MLKPYPICLILLIAVLELSSETLFGQIVPREGDTLNYRLVGFTSPEIGKDKNAMLQVAAGYYLSEDSFKANIISTATFVAGKRVVELPAFGRSYTWRVLPNGKKNVKIPPTLHHFKTGWSKWLDSNLYRIRVTKKAQTYKDGFVFSDRNKVIYNMAGNPVWYMPSISGIIFDYTSIRDFSFSDRGTITMMAGTVPCEIDYTGKVLWVAPGANIRSGDSAPDYHHEFRILNNGNYMVMGNQNLYVDKQMKLHGDSVMIIVPKTQALNSGAKYKKMKFGTLLEFNRAGKLIWSWRSADHLAETRAALPKLTGVLQDNHENSFFFDEQKKFIYISYKTTHQIVKIKYPEGRIIAVYDGFAGSKVPDDNFLFCDQHSVKLSREGYLCVFSNNTTSSNMPPTVLIMREPTNAIEKLSAFWEYAYPVSEDNVDEMRATNGGNIMELPDRSFFVSMCHPFGNLFIVNRKKEIMWDAVLENWNSTKLKWTEESQYRASFVATRQQFESLIWHGK